jgi:hypothetical protein
MKHLAAPGFGTHYSLTVGWEGTSAGKGYVGSTVVSATLAHGRVRGFVFTVETPRWDTLIHRTGGSSNSAATFAAEKIRVTPACVKDFFAIRRNLKPAVSGFRLEE